MLTRLFPVILFSILAISGCAPVTQNQMVGKGGVALAAKPIFDLISGNTLYLEALDFNAYVYFQPDGNFLARGEAVVDRDTDKGGWDINGDNQLCLKFKTWYYGEMRCYAIYPDAKPNEYVFFRDNGAIAYNAKSSSGDSARLYKPSAKSTQKDTYLRESLATGQAAPVATAAPAPQPAAPVAAPAQKETYLRESLAAGQTGAAAPETAANAPTDQQTDETASVAASDAEVEHTVKSMAKNCPGCNMEKSDLRQADLVGANLKGANLKGADLSRANLRRANLEKANLKGAILLSANLPGANLKGADLTDADFTGANLIKADFTGAKTSNMILTNAHLEGAIGLK